jgi:hypothetical protein
MRHPVNFERDLIKMPLSPTRGGRATDLIGELLAEFEGPLPRGFMADNDATRGQQLLHHAQPEREAEVEPDGMADNLGRKRYPLERARAGFVIPPDYSPGVSAQARQGPPS